MEPSRAAKALLVSLPLAGYVGALAVQRLGIMDFEACVELARTHMVSCLGPTPSTIGLVDLVVLPEHAVLGTAVLGASLAVVCVVGGMRRLRSTWT